MCYGLQLDLVDFKMDFKRVMNSLNYFMVESRQFFLHFKNSKVEYVSRLFALGITI